MEPEPFNPELGASAEVAQRRETCRIERWRGYRQSTFYLRAADGTVYESEPFRCRGGEVPAEDGPARAAYEGLVARLREDGWTEHEERETWCNTCFSRPTTLLLPVEEPAEPQVESRAEPRVERRVEPRTVRRDLRRIEPPPPPPPPPEQPAPSRRRVVAIAVASAAGGAAVAAAAALLLVGHPAPVPVPVRAPRAAPPVRPARETHHVAALARAKRPALPTRPATLNVVVEAVRGHGSWIEARRGSRSGPVLYRGVLPVGGRLHLHGLRIWARFGAAANLAITVDGRPVALQGTYDKLFRAAQ